MRIILSNDAFYYLSEGEEPLDEANLDEAERIAAMFPDGYKITCLGHAGDKGCFECDIVPAKADEEPEHVIPLTRHIQLHLNYIGADRVKVMWVNTYNHIRELYGEFPVHTDAKGRKYIHTGGDAFIVGKHSLFYL